MKSKTMEMPALPLTPRPECLPLADMGWDAFEAFCCAFIVQLPKVTECHHYGKQGDGQQGIDMFADFENGDRWAFQSKRRKQFGKGAVATAVKATTYSANRYIILLSRQATAKTRKEIAMHPNWDIWDVRDISRKVRDLPLDIQRRLINDFCGAGIRRAFLGIAAASTFLTAEAFFGSLLDTEKLFNHNWTLIGRRDYVEGLHEFVDSSQKRVAVFLGRGGIGKTKLLHAFSHDFDNLHHDIVLCYLAEGLTITPDSLDDLPSTPCVVVVDDAHRRGEDVEALLAFAKQRTHKLKIVLSARPQGSDYLNSLLTRSNVDVAEVARIGTIGDLSLEETNELSRQALGNDHLHLVDRLTALTRDCPLVTVVAGQLLSHNDVDPMMLDQHVDFRQTVLTKFQDVLIGDVSNHIEPTVCKRLLAMLAAVTPIRPEDAQFQVIAAAFLGTDVDRLADAIGVLEKFGILLRRGYTVRIVPDALADNILHNACCTPQGISNGFAEQLYQKLSPVCITQVLRNLAELDWRIQNFTGEQRDLLAEIWHRIKQEFKAAPNSTRAHMLDTLKTISFFQPGRMLELVQYAMRNPATTPDETWVVCLYQFTQADVLNQLPEILNSTSHSFEFLSCSVDLLWELARDEEDSVPARRIKAMVVLKELASYQYHKSLIVNSAMVEAVGRWLRNPTVHTHLHSPLEVLDAVFEKACHSTYTNSHQFTTKTFLISREETAILRGNALALVRHIAFSNNKKVALRALQSIEKALCDPFHVMGMDISQAAYDQWIPEELAILEILKELIQHNADSLFRLRIKEIIQWKKRYGSTAIKQRAQEIVDLISESFDLQLTRFLKRSSGRFEFFDDEEITAEAMRREYERQMQHRRDISTEYLNRYADAPSCISNLNSRLTEIQESGVEIDPYLLVEMMQEVQPRTSIEFCEAVYESPDSPLAMCFGQIFLHLLRTNVGVAMSFAKRAVELGNVKLCCTLADVFSAVVNGIDGRNEDEIAVLQALLNHFDFSVRERSINVLRSLGSIHPRTAILLAMAVDIGTDSELGDELSKVFQPVNGIPHENLSTYEIIVILKKLQQVFSLKDHTQEFLAVISTRLPVEVVDMLLARVQCSDGRNGPGFDPLPYLGLKQPLCIEDNTNYDVILRRVRDKALTVGHQTHYFLAKLFREVSLGFDPRCLSVLDEWINSGDTACIEAAAFLITEGPANFVFDHFDFVANIISKASSSGDECYQRVSHDLFRCAVAHQRSSYGGGPFPQDISLRDKAAAAMKMTRAGTPVYQFYESLFRHAAGNIRDTIARDEEFEG